MAHIRQPRPDSGLDFQVKVLKTFPLVSKADCPTLPDLQPDGLSEDGDCRGVARDEVPVEREETEGVGRQLQQRRHVPVFKFEVRVCGLGSGSRV